MKASEFSQIHIQCFYSCLTINGDEEEIEECYTMPIEAFIAMGINAQESLIKDLFEVLDKRFEADDEYIALADKYLRYSLINNIDPVEDQKDYPDELFTPMLRLESSFI